MDDINLIHPMHTDIPEHLAAMMMNVSVLSAAKAKLLPERQAFCERL